MKSHETRIKASMSNPANQAYQEEEAKLAAEIMNRYGCRVWVDVGCFHGGLASRVVSKVETDHVVLVDPVWEHLDHAGALIGPRVTSFATIHAAILPESKPSVTIRVPSSHSISTSGVAEFSQFPGEDREVPGLGINDLMSTIESRRTFTYLKIDAEFMDLDIVNALFQDGRYLPAVLEFEVLDIDRYNREIQPMIMSRATSLRYYHAPILPTRKHAYYSVIMPITRPEFYVVGFEKFEIYDSGEYDRLVPRNVLSTMSYRDPRTKSSA